MEPSHMIKQTRRWHSSISCQSLVVKASSLALIGLLLINGSDAIVKQQRSDEIQPKSASGINQQQQSAYNNHQQSASNGQQSVSAPGASSGSASASVSSGSQQQYSSYVQGGQPSKYMSDNLASAASSANSQEQSYQAAANSVQMALANSGIFNPTQGPQGQAPASGSGSGSVQAQLSQPSAQSAAAANPQHYYYYPSKESSSAAAAKAASDLLSNAASNNYQSMSYANYADQLSSALSSMSGAGPDVAASSQDPSYLPQPGGDFGQQNSGQQQQPQQQQQQQNLGPQSAAGYNADMGAYSSNMQSQQSQQQPLTNQQQPGSISFNGPTNGNVNGLSGQQQGGNLGDYLGNSQMQSAASANQQVPQQQQQAPPMGAYSSPNLYSQFGDLSTSNFGNNAGGLASVASYIAPSQQQQQQHLGNDPFASQASQAFSSAASQLSPAAVSPPGLSGNQQTQQQQQNSLYSAASSLFGNAASGQQQPQQQQQTSLFNSPQYLSSFLTPQQFNQLAVGTGQQALGSSLYPDASQMNTAASAPAATSLAPTTSSSGKRFGISSFIMPMLALAGLSLLIPTMSNIGTAVGRKKRSIQESEFDSKQTIAYEPLNGLSGQLAKESTIGEYMDRIEKYYSVYKNAVESEDCLNRLICEFGDAVKDVTGKSAAVTVIEKLVPTWMTGKVHLFKEAALNDRESGKEKCKKYVCHSNKRAH